MTIRTTYPSFQEAMRAIATFWNATFTDTRMVRGVDTVDDVITSKGLVLRSPDGNYWRATISNAGAVTWTNLGATKP